MLAPWSPLRDLVEAVGVDAARYELTRYSVDTPIDIDLGLLTSKSNENPVYYVQYAHARTVAVARNAAEAGVKIEDGVDTSLLDSAADGELLAVLGQFPAAVRDAAKFYEPHRVNRYLEQLASAYHSWYGVSRVAPKAGEEVTDLHRTRLLLNNAAQQVLANGLNLLGERTRAHVIPLDSTPDPVLPGSGVEYAAAGGFVTRLAVPFTFHPLHRQRTATVPRESTPSRAVRKSIQKQEHPERDPMSEARSLYRPEWLTLPENPADLSRSIWTESFARNEQGSSALTAWLSVIWPRSTVPAVRFLRDDFPRSRPRLPHRF